MKLYIVLAAAKDEVKVGKRVAVRTAPDEWYCGKVTKMDSIVGINVELNSGDVKQFLKPYQVRAINAAGKRIKYSDSSIQPLLIDKSAVIVPKTPIKMVKGVKTTGIKRYLRSKVPGVKEFIEKYMPGVDQNKGALFVSVEKTTKEKVGRFEIYYIPYSTIWANASSANQLHVYNPYKKGRYIRFKDKVDADSVGEDTLRITMIYGDTSYTGGHREWS